ncbi:alpha/beta hydrolase [Aquihabitans sp. McL0605]|uniref:alpha/beta hydrolase n=1 Tax=Aquihabitans sp. McL0605 TaxID=3415671 RepID=UPI003CED8C06
MTRAGCRRSRPVAATALSSLLLALVLGGCSSTPAEEPTAGPRPSIARACAGVARGTVSTRHLTSAATRRREPYVIYQPPGTTTGSRLRLLVLLHGASADVTQWLDVGVASTADCMGGRGEGDRTLIVLVDGSGVEHDRRGAPAPTERLVVDEILPAVRARYPHLEGRAGTGIGGISLGGGWAFEIAAHHPDLFSAVGGHSPTVALSAAEVETLARHDVRVWIDVGTSDPLRPRADREAAQLRAAHVATMTAHWVGAHDRRYWSQHVADYLRFYDRAW